MDFRFAQRVASEDKQVKGVSVTDIPLNFCLLNGELSEAFAAWRNGLEMADELADIAILLLALAETVGADLQKAVEAKLVISGEGAHDAVPARPATAVMRDGKLVRDKIPQIIRSKGLEPIIYQASTEEYANRLRDKLREEVEEFLASDDDPEELADILEVLYALAGHAGSDQQQLEKLRAAKASERGGFSDRIIWSGNTPEVRG